QQFPEPSAGSEWPVLSLARAFHYEVPDGYFDAYYNHVVAYVKTKLTYNHSYLDPTRSTEHSKLILALTAIGKDPRNIAGYDLTEALSDYNYVIKQGI